MDTQIKIRPETRDDYAAVHTVQTAAFEGDTAIANLVADLRKQNEPSGLISLVAERETDQPIGHVMLSHAWVDAPLRLVDVMVLSPLGVLPSEQNTGVGTALITAALREANEAGVPFVFLEGDYRYYQSRGFDNAMSLGFRRPSLRIPEKAFQVATLTTNDQMMGGTFVYRDVHWRNSVGLYRND